MIFKSLNFTQWHIEHWLLFGLLLSVIGYINWIYGKLDVG